MCVEVDINERDGSNTVEDNGRGIPVGYKKKVFLR
jgi:DNA gyrase/topoisomerase IV subunit B